MGWDGSGTFTRSYDWTNERDAGNKIDATKFDTENDNFKDGINACLAKNGENAATGNLPMGGNIHTGVGDGTELTHYASIKQIQGGSFTSATAGGTANDLTITLSPALSTLPAGILIKFVASATNTGAATLNVNGIGAKAIQLNGEALTGGEIVSGNVYIVAINGTVSPEEFEIIGPMPSVYRSMASKANSTTNQTIGSSAGANITFANEDYDPYGLHDAVSNTSRIVLGKVGLWSVTGFIASNVALDGSSAMALLLNGVSWMSITINLKREFISGMVYASADTDYVELYVENGTAGSSIINPAYLSAAFVG